MNSSLYLEETPVFAVFESIPANIQVKRPQLTIILNWNCSYTRIPITKALNRRPWCSIGRIQDLRATQQISSKVLQIADFENIIWEDVMSGKNSAASYLVRKGLSRKAQFALQLRKYLAKHPKSILKTAIPYTIIIETWNAFENMKLDLGGGFMTDFNLPDVQRAPLRQRLDWILNDVKETFEDKQQNSSPLWILKPSVANKGADISIIQTWDDVLDALEATEDMREWVLQSYIPRPLLISRGHKFHFRVYVLCVGALSVFVFDEILMLLAAHRYKQNDMNDMLSHLTNTARAAEDVEFDETRFVKLMKDLPSILCREYAEQYPTREIALTAVDNLRSQIHDITAELFAAYENEYSVFCPMQNCFELYGLDFLVDEDMNVSLLEVNPGPDFKQTGDRLHTVIEDLWEQVFRLVIDMNLLSGEDDCSSNRDLQQWIKNFAPDFTMVYSKQWSVASMKGGFSMT